MPTVSVPPTAPAPAGPAAAPARTHRVVALAIFLPCVALLLVAAFLTPAPSGMGTHEQLGLAACGFKVTTGLPCMTCGMTTAFSHAADGDLLASFRTQPAGAVLALATAALALVSGYALVAGVSLAPIGRALARPRSFILLGVLLLGAWAFTILRTLYA